MEEAVHLIGSGLRPAVFILALAAVAGCGLAKPVPLEVPPGHRVVLGRIDVSTLDVREAAIEIVKEDGGFHHEVWVGVGLEDFVLALPAGRYRIGRIRAMRDRRTFLDDPVRDLRLAFQAGPEPAVYIGTIRLTVVFRERRVTVTDEYDRTVAALRARYADLPATIVRRLLVPD